jgi:hypothetical protein
MFVIYNNKGKIVGSAVAMATGYSLQLDGLSGWWALAGLPVLPSGWVAFRVD